MADILRPDTGVIFMKVGTHAQEPLNEIIARKKREIEEAGFALWGYGGSTCHPLTTVQPFARGYERRNGVIYLWMQPMDSKHFAVTERAGEYSIDGLHWQPVPDAINVVGSRYALAIQGLHEDQFDLPLSQTRVAIGNSIGRPGSSYITGRVDKACLELVDDNQPVSGEARTVPIRLVAQLVQPYAVLLRN